MVPPAELGRLVREAREAWSLSKDDLARRARIELDVVDAAERGEADVSDFSSIAASLGGTLDDLLNGVAFWIAPAAAFKSSPDRIEPALLREGLLRLAAAARARVGLAELLQIPSGDATACLAPTAIAENVVQQAEELASNARDCIGHSLEPIASVRAAMKRLGVATFLCDLGTSDVDGLMWRSSNGEKCAAANVRARGGKTTALRMTFAHELAHALFDGSRAQSIGLVEARTESKAGFEQRANAFAAHFLAPRHAVRRFLEERGLRQHEKPNRQHLLSLSAHFGMGVEALGWHLVTCRYWTAEDVVAHRGLTSHDQSGEDDMEHRPTPAEASVAIERRGEVLELATLALARGDITVGRWRELLDLDLSHAWRDLLAERQVDIDHEHRAL